MGYPVYSTHFATGIVNSAATATALTYTVPAGKVAVVRSIEQFVGSLGTILVGRFIGSTVFPFSSTADVALYHCVHWDGDQVLNAGDQIRAQWLNGQSLVSVSGFLLNALP